MKAGSGYLHLESRYPLKGLNSSIPATQLNSSFSPSLTNMRIREGVVFKREGYFELAATAVMVGDILALLDFETLANVKTLIAITTKRQYKATGTPLVWSDITVTEGQHAIVAADDTVDFVEISDDHTAAFAVDAQFEIEGSASNNGTYTITAVAFASAKTKLTIAGGSLTNNTVDGVVVGPLYKITGVSTSADTITIDGDFTALFVSGKTFVVENSTDLNGTYNVTSSTLVASDTVISVSQDITGSPATDGDVHLHREGTAIDGDYVDWTPGTDNNTHKLYATNGRDRPVFWDGTNARFRAWHPEFTNFTTCKSLEIFFDYLVLGNITLAGNTPKTMAWSDLAEFETFNTGDSGTQLLPALQGNILRLELLGDRLMIYSRNTIGSYTFVGGTTIFAYQTVLQDTRLVSGQSIVSIGSAHLYAAQENIYFFDGTRSIRAVGDSIRLLYKQALDFEFGDRLFIFNDVARRVIFIVVPTSSTTSVIFILDYDIFNLNEFKWTQIEYTNRPQSMGFFSRRTAPDWDDPPDNPWNEEQGTWADESERVNFPVRIMGSSTKAYLVDETQTDDDGTAITGRYETTDFVVPIEDQSVFGRWGEIEVDFSGQEVKVYYSIDQGSVWTLVETKTLTSEFNHYSFPIDTVSRTLRVKLQSTRYFAFRWIRVWVRPGAPR